MPEDFRLHDDPFMTECFDRLEMTMVPMYDIGDTSPLIYRIRGLNGVWVPGSEHLQGEGRIRVPLHLVTPYEARELYTEVTRPFRPSTHRGYTLFTVWRPLIMEIEVGFMLISDVSWAYEYAGGSHRPSWLNGVETLGATRMGEPPIKTAWERLLHESDENI